MARKRKKQVLFDVSNPLSWFIATLLMSFVNMEIDYMEKKRAKRRKSRTTRRSK